MEYIMKKNLSLNEFPKKNENINNNLNGKFNSFENFQKLNYNGSQRILTPSEYRGFNKKIRQRLIFYFYKKYC
tara:strand:- start:486 stop:704 length:219 start_codon:yes stop_codon:yes gene_type:complete